MGEKAQPTGAKASNAEGKQPKGPARGSQAGITRAAGCVQLSEACSSQAAWRR